MKRNVCLRLMTWTVAVALAAGASAACGAADGGKEEGTMKLTSTAFPEGGPIPARHAGGAPDVSPALQWSGAPEGTKAFALVCDDPDAPAGDWVHWVVYGIPATAAELPENMAKTDVLPDGSRQGLNDFHRVGYIGPMPPPGTLHRYFFTLYALDAGIDLEPRATKQDLLRAIQGHVLAQARLTGTYQRRR